MDRRGRDRVRPVLLLATVLLRGVGESTDTSLVLGVGNLGPTCFSHIRRNDTIKVTLFDPNRNAVSGAEWSGIAVAATAARPVVESVTAPYGPESGRNTVTVSASSSSPEAFWFGGYQVGVGWYGVATTKFQPQAGRANSYSVTVPEFRSGRDGIQNYGVSVFAADQRGGLSNQACNVLIAGCANEYLYMRHSQFHVDPTDLSFVKINKSVSIDPGTPSQVCGLANGTGTGRTSNVTFGANMTGKVGLDAGLDLSYSNARIPEAVVGNATLTVTEPVTFTVSIEGSVGGCVEIPIPIGLPPGSEKLLGLYVVVGGKIEAKLSMAIKIARGTYRFTGGWVPSVPGRPDTGGFGTAESTCLDDDGQPATSCVSTEFAMNAKGALSVTPIWLQIGPNFGALKANVGVGLTAAAEVDGTVTIPPWPPKAEFGWDVCASVRWAANVSIKAPAFIDDYEKSWGDNLASPLNLAGDGKCPLRPVSAAATPTAPIPPAMTASGERSTISATPGGTGGPSTVQVALADAGGNPVQGKIVTLRSTPTPTAAPTPGTVESPPTIEPADGVLTDVDGVAVFEVTGGAGAVTFTATDTTDAVTLIETANLTLGVPFSQAAESTLVAIPGVVPADGSSTAILQVSLRDSAGDAIAGHTVTLTADGGTPTITPSNVVTNGDGEATFLVSDHTVDKVTFTALDTTSTVAVFQTADVVFEPVTVSAVESDVNVTSATVPADSVSFSTVSVTLKDSGGAPVSGKTVSLTQDAENRSVITPTSATTGADGSVSFKVRDAIVERVRYTAVDTTDHITLDGVADVSFTPGPVDPAASSVTVDSAVDTDVELADDIPTATVTVVLHDDQGRPVPDQNVTLEQTGSSTISDPSGPSDANGIVTFTVAADTAEQVTYTATDTTEGTHIRDGANVTFAAPTVSDLTSYVTASPRIIDPGGSAAVTVTLRDAAGAPVAGIAVTLHQVLENGTPANATVQQIPSALAQGLVTDVNGAANFVVTDATSENVHLFATYGTGDGIELSHRDAVDFTIDARTAYFSSAEAHPEQGVTANGTDSSTITVTVRDGNLRPVAGKAITLRALDPTRQHSIVSKPDGLSDSDGHVTFTVTDRVAETVVYVPENVTDNDLVSPDYPTVTFGAAQPRFVTVQPGRLLDTRSGHPTVDDQYSAIGELAAGSITEIGIAGRAGVPPDARDVVLNITVTAPQAAGYLTVYPCDSRRPHASHLNYTAGQTIANTVVSRIGNVGTICVYTQSATHLVIDLNGYFPTGAAYHATTPARVLDSRTGATTADGLTSGIGIRPAGSVTEVHLAGRAGVPLDAQAVALNITITEAAGPGFLTVYPCGAPRPNASTLNYTAGQTVANAALTKLGTGGTVCLYTQSPGHLVVDVNGYFSRGSDYVPQTPARLVESRSCCSTIDGQAANLGPQLAGTVREVTIAGRAAIPDNTETVVLNVTVTDVQAAGFLTIYQCGNERPNTSNLNAVAGQTIANLVVADLGTTGSICVYASSTLATIIDVAGYLAL